MLNELAKKIVTYKMSVGESKYYTPGLIQVVYYVNSKDEKQLCSWKKKQLVILKGC